MGRSLKWPAWRLGRAGPAEWLALLALALFLTAVQAFDVAAGEIGVRASYWLICILGGGAMAALVELLLEAIPALAARPLLRAVAQTLAMTFPVTVLVWVVTALIGQADWSLAALVQLSPKVLVVDAVVVVLAWLLRRALRPPPQSKPREASEANPMAAKLTPKLARAALVAVQAEDHYLRVYTDAGEALVYMRFADAMALVEAGDGLRVHRSWWVARSAVEQVRWRNGRGELTLAGGLRVPVSRRYAADVRAQAWAGEG